MTLTRVITLHARHRYADGADHGHLYRIDVTVRRGDAPETDQVIDLATFDRILTDEIAEPLGGCHLNAVIGGEATPPTCEAVARWCWRRVAPRLPPAVVLERVRVAEDATLWADCSASC